MQKINFLVIVLSLLISSCSKDDEPDKIEVSFHKSEYFLEFSENTQEVEVVLALSKAIPSNINIGVNYSGSASEPFDFSGLDELKLPENSVTVSFVVIVKYNVDNTKDKDIKIDLELPSGYKFGEKSSSSIYISGK